MTDPTPAEVRVPAKELRLTPTIRRQDNSGPAEVRAQMLAANMRGMADPSLTVDCEELLGGGYAVLSDEVSKLVQAVRAFDEDFMVICRVRASG